MIRCTCLYRASTPEEQTTASTALAVSVRDPFCPAGDLHERTGLQPPGRVTPSNSDEWPLSS